jgi:hypothetical protein
MEGGDAVAEGVDQQKGCRAEGAGQGWEASGEVVVREAESGRGGGEGEDGEGQVREVGGGPAGGAVGRVVRGLETCDRVLPGIEVEAVEGADAGEECGGGE